MSLSAALHAALLEEPNAERVRSEPVHELAWKNGCLISFPHGCSRAAWFEDLVGGISKSERSAGGSRDVMERCRGSVHEIGRGTGQYGCWRGDRRVDAVSRSEVVSRKPDRIVSRASSQGSNTEDRHNSRRARPRLAALAHLRAAQLSRNDMDCRAQGHVSISGEGRTFRCQRSNLIHV